MNASVYLCMFLPMLIFLWEKHQQNKMNTIRRIKSKRKGQQRMSAIVNNYINKECYITTMSTTLKGTIKEVTEGWLTLDNGKTTDAVNLDYITQIREIPVRKKI